MLLKPGAAAIRDRDRLYVGIRGTAVNQDGRTAGLTVPNPEAQAELIRRVSAESGPARKRWATSRRTAPAPPSVTPWRWPRSVPAGQRPPPNRPPGRLDQEHIGHLEAAAGVAGIIRRC